MSIYSQLHVRKISIFIMKAIDFMLESDHMTPESDHVINEKTKNFVKLIKISLIIFFKFNLNHLFIGIGDYKKYFMLYCEFFVISVSLIDKLPITSW